MNTRQVTLNQNPYQRTATLDSSMEYMGSIMTFLAKTGETAGRLAVMELQTQPGNEPPPHVHDWENELFYILEGRLEVYCDGKILHVGPGEMAFLPQGKPHAFYILSPHVRMLILVQATSAHDVGLDSYFVEMATPAASMALPLEAVTHGMADPAHAIAVGAKYGVHILSPADTAKELPHYPGFGFNPAAVSVTVEQLSAIV
jgi:quercetin dioxygenase-like cupin family protein